MSVLVVEHLKKSFDSHVAVDDVSFTVDRGEVFGLLGPNGAGKSTTMSMVAGLITPDAGKVTITSDDKNGSVADPRLLLGVVPQDLAIYPDLTVRENLTFFGSLYGLSRDELHRRVDSALDRVGLADRQTSPTRTLSGGMKRRLNFAVALLHEPKLLILDEPTVGVDPQSRNKIFESIEELHRQGRTIIYTTHYMEEAERLCDRIAIVDAGKLLALGTLDELLAQYGGPPTLVVTTNGEERRMQTGDPLAELNRIAAHSKIDAFQMERPTLEQVFLRLTGRSLRD